MGGRADSIIYESQNNKWLMAAERACATLWIDKSGLGLYRQQGVFKKKILPGKLGLRTKHTPDQGRGVTPPSEPHESANT